MSTTITLGNVSSTLNNQVLTLLNSNTKPWNYNTAYGNTITSGTTMNPYLKKYEINESIEDILVYSCTAYRLKKSGRTGLGLLSIAHHDNITPEDVLLANKIREFYQQKVLVWKLKDSNLTHYRKDLSDFIHSDGKKFVDRTIPLVYRLPEMYHYDSSLEMVREEFTIVDKFTMTVSQDVRTFKPVIALDRVVRGKKGIDYWMVDDTGIPYRYSMPDQSSLRVLWEREFQKNKIQMGVKTKRQVFDDLVHFEIQKILEIA